MLFKLIIRGQLAVLATALSGAALAQSAPVPPSAPAHAQAGAAASQQLTYRSALDGYQPFKDEQVANWSKANQTVGEIGGWRAYAKEASQTEGKSQAPAQPQSGQAPSGASNPHAPHGKH